MCKCMWRACAWTCVFVCQCGPVQMHARDECLMTTSAVTNGFFKTGSLTKTGNHWPAKVADQWTLMPHQVHPFTSPFPARYRDTNFPDQLLSQCQGSELGSSRCVASPLLTETSSQVLKEFEANLQAQPLSDKLHSWIFYGLWLRRIKSHS